MELLSILADVAILIMFAGAAFAKAKAYLATKFGG